MRLENLLEGVEIVELIGSIECEINDFHFDSREIGNNDLFIAISGTSIDGSEFIDNAIDNGATAIICSDIPKHLDKNVTYIKSSNLRSYYHKNILAFGDLLHRIHPLAGQGFNMTIRDINVFINIIKNKIDLGLPIDSSVNYEFEKNLKHKNYIFSNSIDFVQEFFNFERKLNNNVLSKSLKILGKNSYINKLFTKVADKGINF